MSTCPVVYDPAVIAKFRTYDTDAPQDADSIIREIVSVYVDRILHGSVRPPDTVPRIKKGNRTYLVTPPDLEKRLRQCVKLLHRPRVYIIRAALLNAADTLENMKQAPVFRTE